MNKITIKQWNKSITIEVSESAGLDEIIDIFNGILKILGYASMVEESFLEKDNA